MTNYKVIGIMSGTSVDGLDIAHCTFKKEKNWSYRIDNATTIKYPKKIKETLLKAYKLNGYELIKLDHFLGDFIGEKTKKFIRINNLNPEIISCHGHTIFHNLQDKISFQIGNANRLFSKLKIPIINNFRELDVIFNGQGAPLVPIGEKLLFYEYKYFVNIGGILNLTIINNKKIIAYDIVPSNIILNNLSNKLNYEYDNKGILAKKGKIIPKVFKQLNSLSYYKKLSPKSLGIEWVKKNIYPIIDNPKYDLIDIINTYTQHIAYQLAKNIKTKENNILVTGGGTYNNFLMEKINFYDNQRNNWKIPNDILINYKEALIFAFIGLLRKFKQKNILKSVTGSSINLSSGNITENINN